MNAAVLRCMIRTAGKRDAFPFSPVIVPNLQIRSSPWTRREQEVTFHRNGTMSSNDGNKGEWWFDVGGLYWVRTVQIAETVDPADI